MRLRIGAATWWQHCHDTGAWSVRRVAQPAAGRIEEQRLGELAVGHEGALGAGDDAHRQAGTTSRLGARDREQQRVARPSGRHAIEQEVVDRAGHIRAP